MLQTLDPAKAYRMVDFDARVGGLAGPDLVRLCFEEIDAALDRALWAHDRQRTELRYKSLERAQLGVSALLLGLDRSHPAAASLDTFYRSLVTRLMASRRAFDPADVAEVRRDMADVRQSFFG
ncbi:flagellar protein FliS [Parerythrobacter lacustris]|uniref:Flagellar protein FliS n=1 Tax=Parerythrobacter lacustris TaxID=2969984 RepID=A0ABT1XMB2_9SPHN|nr:flagellar protein FliS [Parerythrobacter lacustris]MCR2832793.1 flagellar protein FliS [Parerythrobacter lacustris]